VKRDHLVVTRDDLVKASQIAYAVVDDDSQPDELRADAADVEFRLSEALCYQSHGADDERSIRLLPIGMKWPQHFTSMEAEFEIDLPAQVREDMPAHLLMARLAAKYCDDALLSADFRLDAYDCLNQILAALTRAADEADDELVK
jgi:hypothetical protein